MRKLVFAINITLDGCCNHNLFNPDEELLEYFSQLMRNVDVLVYGRKTYELMVPYWPELAKKHSGDTEATIGFAKAFDSVNKIIVFSQSLDRAESKNTSVVRTNLKDEILKLKQVPGKNISTGGVNVPSQLMELGLIDEYHFVVHPIIAGEGRRLLEGIGLQEKLKLRLAESKIFNSGVVAHRYNLMPPERE
jgi:dihydrofolate reductase